MSDAVEQIKAFYSRRNFGTAENLRQAQREVATAYRSLKFGEGAELVSWAVASLGDKETRAKDALAHLACFHPGSLDGSHQHLLRAGLFYPPVIYHGAGDEVAREIIESIDEPNVNLALMALAWIGSQTAQRAFSDWRESPPAWAIGLHVPTHAYAEVGGWELTANGTRRNLFFRTCHPLVPPERPEAVAGVIRINTPHEASCRWCKRQLTTLLDIDLSHPLLGFLGLDGERLRIMTCDVCTCYGMIFTRVDWLGASEWFPGNTPPEYLPADSSDWDRLREDALLLSKIPRQPTESADRNMPISFSQIGGYPSWEQDAEYPICPSCQRKMAFVAQLSNEDYERGEGIYYAFLCPECRIAATHYQQT